MSARPRLDVLLLTTVAFVAAWLGKGNLALSVDVESLALKSLGTAADTADATRRAAFGEEPTLLFLLSPRIRSTWDADGEAERARWLEELRKQPEVARVHELPTRDPEEELLAVDPVVGPDRRYAAATERLVSWVRASRPPTTRVAISGQPEVEVVLSRELRSEQARVVPLLVGALAAFLFLVYRRPVLAIGGLLAPLAGVAMLGGIEAHLGLSLDPVSSLLAPAVLTVGVAASIHVIERTLANRALGHPMHVATVEASRSLLLPFVLAAVTTVSGFIGLTVSPIPAIRRFGWLASFGVILTTALALYVLPAFLRVFHGRARHVHRRTSAAEEHVGVFLALLARRFAVPIVVLSLAGTAVLGWSWTHLSVDPDLLRLLPPDHPLRVDTAAIAAQTGSVDRFDLLLEPPHPANRLLALPVLTARLTEIPGIAGLAGPPRRSKDDLMLIPLLIGPSSSVDRVATARAVEDAAHALGWEHASATGLPIRVARDSALLVAGQLRGLAITLFLVWAVMSLGFRSAALGLLGLIPNVLPCVLVYGGMAFLGRRLTVASALIGAVMLGLIVDDTIHFVHTYVQQRERGRARITSVAHAQRNVGRAIVVTSLCLMTGFAVTVAGRLETTREFGLLATTTVGAALLADLVLLPAVLLLPRARERRARGMPCSVATTTTS